MEKTSIEMDLGEWEFLPDSKSFLGFGHEGGKDLLPKEIRFNTKGIVDMNYFICPSPTSPFIHAEEAKSNPATETKKPLPPPIVPEPVAKKKPDDEAPKEFKDIGVVPPVIVADHDAAVSQVFFKVKENEFVDMKMNSPKSNTKGIIPHIEPDPIRFDEQGKEEMEQDEDQMESEVKGKPCWESFGFNIWRWRLAGIGALCSIGVAAATFCIFILGGRQRQKQQHHNQRIQFQIYADDKRIKQMMQQATRLNHALSTVRGGPMTRAQNVAHISFGGYYDGL